MIIGFFYAVIDMSIWWFKTLIFQHLAILFSNKTNRFPSHLLLIFLCACCWIVYFTFRLVGKEGKKTNSKRVNKFLEYCEGTIFDFRDFQTAEQQLRYSNNTLLIQGLTKFTIRRV